MFASKPENDHVVDTLQHALLAMSYGDVLTYRQLTIIAGRDVQRDHRYLLMRARDLAEKHNGSLFESVRAVGIKRLTASETPEVGLTAIRGIRRKARHGVRRLARINSNSLSDTERKRAIAYSALLGAVALLSDGHKARAVAVVADPAKPIPPHDVLRMFADE